MSTSQNGTQLLSTWHSSMINCQLLFNLLEVVSFIGKKQTQKSFLYSIIHLMQDMPHNPSHRHSFLSFWQSLSCMVTCRHHTATVTVTCHVTWTHFLTHVMPAADTSNSFLAGQFCSLQRSNFQCRIVIPSLTNLSTSLVTFWPAPRVLVWESSTEMARVRAGTMAQLGSNVFSCPLFLLSSS